MRSVERVKASQIGRQLLEGPVYFRVKTLVNFEEFVNLDSIHEEPPWKSGMLHKDLFPTSPEKGSEWIATYVPPGVVYPETFSNFSESCGIRKASIHWRQRPDESQPVPYFCHEHLLLFTGTNAVALVCVDNFSGIIETLRDGQNLPIEANEEGRKSFQNWQRRKRAENQ